MNIQGRVAIVTDALVAFGGADRVLKELCVMFPEYDIFTSLFIPEVYPWLDPKKVRTMCIQKWPGTQFWKRHYVPFSPIGFEQFDFSGYELVISLSAGCAKGVVTTADTLHIGIILTPPRNQWDGVPRRWSPVRSIIDGYLRVWDVEAGMRPDILVAISKYIQSRINQVYKRDSTVVYPGIDTSFWTLGPRDSSSLLKRKDQYLVVSRLHDYKMIDLAIRACTRLWKKLVVIGDGPELRRLKKIRSEIVTFLGYMSDEVVRDYMRTSRGFLFPGVEDFGLAPVEAMGCGAPVVAYYRGGVPETVIEGKTGICLVHRPKRHYLRL